MRALKLDYRSTNRDRMAGYLLGVIALAFASDVTLQYLQVRDALDNARTRLANARSTHAPARHAAIMPVTTEQYSFARKTVNRLVAPWQGLFRALESARTERVALLAIEPDVENRTVSLSGEAKDYLAVLSYVANLAEQKGLTRVHLVRHEIRPGSAERAVTFTISAAWQDLQ